MTCLDSIHRGAFASFGIRVSPESYVWDFRGTPIAASMESGAIAGCVTPENMRRLCVAAHAFERSGAESDALALGRLIKALFGASDESDDGGGKVLHLLPPAGES